MASESDNECDLDILNALLENEDNDDFKESDEIDNSLKDVDFDFLSKETNTNNTAINKSSTSSPTKINIGVHSSDEEDPDYFKKRDYSNYGQEIKQMLKEKVTESIEPSSYKQSARTSTLSTNIKKPISSTPSKVILPTNQSKNLYSDPVFGYSINKPLISSIELVQLMEGRKPVKLSALKQFLSAGKPSEDWVIAGVLTHKTPCKKTAKGDSFSIWKLSDLTMDMNTVSVFMFRNAYKNLWKVSEGSVIGILNANVMENRDKNDHAAISVDNPARVMIMGTSRDMGTCKSKKKNGDQCTSIINTRLCEYCVYHVKQEYSKHSKRSDLQSSFNGKGVTMNNLKKNPFQNQINRFQNVEQTYRTVPAKKSAAAIAKDKERLEMLKANAPIKQETKDVKPKFERVEFAGNQSKKDADRLMMLKKMNKEIEEKVEKIKPEVLTPPPKVMSKTERMQSAAAAAPRTAARFDFSSFKSGPASSKSSVMTPKNGLKPKVETLSAQALMMSPKTPKFDLGSLGGPKVPRLGVGVVNGVIDFASPSSKRKVDAAKQTALEWIKKNGTIKPSNPNHILASKEVQARQGVKRKRVEEEEVKKSEKETFAEKFKQLMEAKSSHTDLIENAEEEQKEKYFNKLEAKEKMEEKMLTTFKVPCKAVRCSLCKYTAFSAAELCKEGRHPIKVFDAVKRFYKCGDCGNRTVTLDRIPTTACSKCSGSSWVKTAMMDEKRTQIKTSHLSIRGDEEKFYGHSDNANINLIVPD